MSHFPATEYLEEEHRQISLMLDIMEQISTRVRQGWRVPYDDLSRLFDFFKDYADAGHHAKEEDILFTALYELGALPGGPRCSYFSDLILLKPPTAALIETMNREMGLEGGLLIEPSGILTGKQIAPGNPLNPVLEEHVLGRKTMQRLAYELEQLRSEPDRSVSSLLFHLNGYIDLLRGHIAKEDTCLFKMTNDCLSRDKQVELAQKFAENDKALHEGNEPYADLVQNLKQKYLLS